MLKDSQITWKKTLEDHLQIIKTKAIVRAAIEIESLTMDEIIFKFDLGAIDHHNDERKIDASKEFRDEMIDAVCYQALLLTT